MRAELPDEYYALADSVEGVLSRRSGVDVLRAHWEGTAAAPSGALWHELAGLGLGSLTRPEASGGHGLPYLSTVLVAQALGRHAVAEPVLETAAVACPFLGAVDGPAVAGALDSLAAGVTTASVQDGWDGWAPWGADVDLVLVADDTGVALCHPGPADAEAAGAPPDPARRPARVRRSAEYDRIQGPKAADRLRTLARVATAAALLGLGDEVVRRTVEYAKVRRQFDRPIGSFQAVKHQLADAWVQLEYCRRFLWKAAYQVDAAAGAAPVTARAAKALAGDAALRASYVGLQVHGGIGYTWDCDLHLWLKRIQVLDASFGSSDTHWGLLADEWFPLP